MSNLPNSAKEYADRYKTGWRGIVDFYQFLEISRSASDDEITRAILAKSQVVEVSVMDNYFKMLMLTSAQKALGTPDARALYDKKLTPLWLRLLDRANNLTKRMALLTFPFFLVVATYLWAEDHEGCCGWEPSLTFFIFAMASVLCLLIAFTRLGDWLRSE